MSHRILVVDDEQGVREALRQLLEYEGYAVMMASSGPDALGAHAEFKPHLVLLDVKMAGMDGLAVLARLREADPNALVVMISGHGTIATAVEATQLGAHDFLEKPLDTHRVLLTLKNALQHVVLEREVRALKAAVEQRHEIVGSSSAIQQVLERIEKVAPTPARLLITGENGTGKELVARAVHRLSPRANRAFVEVNCGGYPVRAHRIRAVRPCEGFVHGARSRTGSASSSWPTAARCSWTRWADMSPAAQSKVLRVLQEGVITPIGSSAQREGGRAGDRGHQQESSRTRSPSAGSARTCSTG